MLPSRMLLVSVGVLMFVLMDSTVARPNRDQIHQIACRSLRHRQTIPLVQRHPSRAQPHSKFGSFLSEPCRLSPESVRMEENNSGNVNPVLYGADPSGLSDSSDAFDKAVEALLRRNTSSHHMASLQVVDLGGAMLDLQGGDYLISRPIVVPHGFGNFGIGHGTIRASQSFPSAADGFQRYLIEISDLSAQGCKAIDKGQKSCNEKINIVNLLFDGSRIAWGCLNINYTMGGNVGPDNYFVNFMKKGITINGGHEIMVHESWFGATYYSTPNHTQGEAGSTSLEILGNDHVVSDIIAFGGQTAVYVDGGANLIEGVHTWNDATHADSPGHGIIVNNTQSIRIVNCYLDYTALRIEGPSHISIVNSFFLGGGTIVLAPASLAGKPEGIEGLIIKDNTWENFNMGKNTTIVLDERERSFPAPIDMVLSGNIGTNTMIPLAVTVTKTMYQSKSKSWLFNFSDSLLFPSLPILQLSYSLTADSDAPFTMHMARAPSGLNNQSILVETQDAIGASVTVTATQGIFTAGNNWL